MLRAMKASSRHPWGMKTNRSLVFNGAALSSRRNGGCYGFWRLERPFFKAAALNFTGLSGRLHQKTPWLSLSNKEGRFRRPPARAAKGVVVPVLVDPFVSHRMKAWDEGLFDGGTAVFWPRVLKSHKKFHES